MADQNVANGDAVQTGDHTFTISGTQAGEVALPNNLSIADADFSYDGSDLVLTFPDGTTVTVEGYAENPNPPTLVSADGAQVGHDVVTQLTMADGAGADAPATGGQFGFIQPEQAESTVTAEQSSGNIAANPTVIAGTDGEPIGNVESLNGEVFAIRVDGSRVRLELGDQVFQGDILESGPNGNVGVLLADQTTFAMGPEGRMVLDEMIYDPATQQGSVSMSVLQGVFTFVSGQVAKTDPDAMTLDTPVATIGIRGTQVGLDLRDGENLNVHLMEERFGFVGEVVIVNDGGVQVLNDANAFSTISSFDIAPSPFSIVSVDDIVSSYGEQTLRYLPTRNSDGERTSANTYQETSDNQNNNTDFLNDFQTDAGGPQQQTPTETINVAGDLIKFQTVNQVNIPTQQVEQTAPDTGTQQTNNGTDNNNNNDVGVGTDTGADVPTFPEDIQDLIDRGILTDVVVSADGKTITANVPEDFDSGDMDYTFVLTGVGGDNAISTGDGDDTLRGTEGDDILIGGAGDDLFLAAPGLGDDTYDGGIGNDTITYAATDNDLTIDLSAGTATDGLGANGIGNDTILNIENVIGGSGNDIIIGNEYANILEGGAGDDFIDGRGGMDTAVFSGSFGESTIRVVDGVLTVTGPDGTDTIENVENFAFTDSPNLIVGLEDTAMSVDVVDHVPSAATAGSVLVTGLPDGASLSSGIAMPDGSWLVSGSDLEGLTLTGAANSAEDFTLNFTTYAQDLAATANGSAENVIFPLTSTGTGFANVNVIGIVDPFTFTVGGVELTADGAASTITFAGTEDAELPLNILNTLTDTDGSEVLSVTLSGLPTLEVHEVSYEVPVLDGNGQPVFG